MNPLAKELEYFFDHFSKWYDDYVLLHNTYVESQSLQNVGVKKGVINESGRYIPLLLQEKINKLTFHHSVLKDRFQNVHINLEVYQPVLNVSSTKLQKYIIRVMYVIVFFVCKIRPLHKIINVNIKIVCSQFKKRLPSTGHLSTFNVNTGVTTTYLNRGKADILIYRQEEVLKVLIHELLHAFGVDSLWMMPDTEAPLNAFFGVNMTHKVGQTVGTLKSNESFTDSYACMLNIFLATMFSFHGDTQEQKKYMFHALVGHERTFVVKQAYKLFPLLGLKISSKTGAIINNVGNRDEDTHVISYYILKALNFVHLPNFINYLRRQGWRSTEDGVEYVQYLKKLLKKSFRLMTKSRQRANVYYEKRLLKTVQDNQSLRMSCVDISTI
jgi:hypothetical protein